MKFYNSHIEAMVIKAYGTREAAQEAFTALQEKAKSADPMHGSKVVWASQSGKMLLQPAANIFYKGSTEAPFVVR